MKTSAYEKKLMKDHEKFMNSIKTTNDVWDKLLNDSTTINASWMFNDIAHLFSNTKENDDQVEITVTSLNRFNGITRTITLWINPKTNQGVCNE